MLSKMVHPFGNKPLLKHQARRFEQLTLFKAYNAEDRTFSKTFKVVLHDQVSENANFVNSHVLHRIKKNFDGSRTFKARITPHRNEDYFKSV